MPDSPLAIVQVPGSQIRRFADDGVNAAVSKMLATIPADKHAQLFAVADLTGAKVGVAWKIAGGWSITGVLEKPWKGDLKGEIAMRLEI
jgi:hypothetical protein